MHIANTTRGESRAAARLVNALIAAGYLISVNDGEETTINRTVSAQLALSALATTDMNILVIHRNWREESTTWPRVGTITLIYGNATDGSELVADWSWRDTPEGEAFNAFMDGLN